MDLAWLEWMLGGIKLYMDEKKYTKAYIDLMRITNKVKKELDDLNE